MTQENAWDKEYRQSKFLTKDNKPQADVVRFVKYLKKTEKIVPDGLSVIDLGSGTGRNSFYFAELGSKVLGLEISETAINIAQKNITDFGTAYGVEYKKQSIGEKFPCEDNSFDVALDITSSNSLTEAEREVFLSETKRVLKDGGYFFTKALCKDGDDNAKYLLKNNPGREGDTYILPDIGVVERVWRRERIKGRQRAVRREGQRQRGSGGGAQLCCWTGCGAACGRAR